MQKQEAERSSFDSLVVPNKTEVMSKDKLNLPNGKHKGVISGYTVTLFGKNGSMFTFNTNVGIKGRNVPVSVVVKDRIAYVETI